MTLISSSKKHKRTKQAFWCTRNLQGNAWKNRCLDYRELPNIFSGDVKGYYFEERTETRKNLGNFLGKEVENMNDHRCLKIRDLVDEEIWICSGYPIKNNIPFHCAERKAKLHNNWTKQQ